jgi:hypothetical protein
MYHHLLHCAKSEVDRIVTWPTDHFETMELSKHDSASVNLNVLISE